MRGSLHWSVNLPQHVVAGTCLYAGRRKVGVGVGVGGHWSTSLPQHVAEDSLASGRDPHVNPFRGQDCKVLEHW